jgi:8-oxo-dGTP diphosphatase
MNPFLVLDESSFDPNLAPSSREGYYVRRAARAVVSDENGAIALLHVSRHSYYKLPGGGIDGDETPLQALDREMLEEIGCRVTVTGEIGTVVEQRYVNNMTQTSYCFRAKVVGEKGQPDFTEKELAGGFEIVWAENINKAIELLESSVNITDDAINIAFMRMRDSGIVRQAAAILNQ